MHRSSKSLEEWVYVRQIVDFREEKVYNYRKKINSHFIERKFVKEQSVFRDWHEDDDSIRAKCLENDFGLWKVSKLNLDPEDLYQCKEIIEENFA